MPEVSFEILEFCLGTLHTCRRILHLYLWQSIQVYHLGTLFMKLELHCGFISFYHLNASYDAAIWTDSSGARIKACIAHFDVKKITCISLMAISQIWTESDAHQVSAGVYSLLLLVYTLDLDKKAIYASQTGLIHSSRALMLRHIPILSSV